jgi:hypothetical protein
MSTSQQLDYREKLRLPQWQRKRLEIMQRDDFRCQKCKDGTTTLNVHHKSYEWGRDPWDYPDSNLATLCQPCHEGEHGIGPSKEKRQPLSIYLAGKITKNGWRDGLVSGLRGAGMGSCGDASPQEESPDMLDAAIFGEHHYVGPFFLSCDHGCFHGKGTHGATPSPDHRPSLSDKGLARMRIWSKCFRAIRECDLLFAWIDSKDCYGTLVEIGFAKGLGKHVKVAMKKGVNLDDLWLTTFCSTINSDIVDAPEEALRTAIEDYYPFKKYEEEEDS